LEIYFNIDDIRIKKQAFSSFLYNCDDDNVLFRIKCLQQILNFIYIKQNSKARVDHFVAAASSFYMRIPSQGILW